ncbi:ADP-ribosylglycohydrolase family protein [Streptomyces sp. TRM66268-LWL]|uniref:ADP-ribosylglycohydrolase family protein n=1 Tax=Streptomyces polyasparticus TaxID=2767826 RepID=A0ABR7S9I1_9ACTN|nr:ADP-ribosylglycohydrolase family protein [Streptomyces polyasparticus]MBC9712141.1 ADP-ribosylglycohydrolase family protein [Streptomyces polyasparticus]
MTAAVAAPLRLTWVQPEDLIGHELRQLALEGRDVSALERRWLAAGGHLAPDRAGASAGPATPELRRLATELLDEAAAISAPAALEQIRTKFGCGGPGAKPPVSGRGGTGEEETPPTHLHALHAAWLGRAAGCLLGKPVEKLPLQGIRQLARAAGNWPLRTWFTERGVPADLKATYPWNRRSATTSLAENINGMPEDDDLNYPLLGLLLLQRHGKTFTTADVAKLWLDELPAGRTFTAERIAYRNLLDGIEPPHTARHRNPFREWIGALIRADLHGWTNPGQPERAAAQARRDAELTHTGNGVHGAEFIAAVIAEAATGADVHQAIGAGLEAVPEDTHLYRAIAHARQLAYVIKDFDEIVDVLHQVHAEHHWVHVIPNTAAITAALLHADGDFTATITRAVSAGWDTDSNGATAGSIAGLIAGHPDRIPAQWTDPLRNHLSTTVAGFDGIGFDTLAQLTFREAARS